MLLKTAQLLDSFLGDHHDKSFLTVCSSFSDNNDLIKTHFQEVNYSIIRKYKCIETFPGPKGHKMPINLKQNSKHFLRDIPLGQYLPCMNHQAWAAVLGENACSSLAPKMTSKYDATRNKLSVSPKGVRPK